MRRYVAASAGLRKSAPAGGAGKVEVARSGPAREQARVQRIVVRIRSCSGYPSCAYPIANSSTSPRRQVPNSRRSRSQPPKAPGTHAARTPVPGNELVAELVEALDRRRGGRDALPAERERLAERPTRTPRASRRPARSDGARRPGGRTRPRSRRRTRCRLARAPPSRSGKRASASSRPSRTCRGAPDAS